MYDIEAYKRQLPKICLRKLLLQEVHLKAVGDMERLTLVREELAKRKKESAK